MVSPERKDKMMALSGYNSMSKAKFLIPAALMLGIFLCFLFNHYLATVWQNIIWLKEETDHLVIYYKKGTYAALNIEQACQEYEQVYLKMKSQIPVGRKTNLKKLRLFLHEQQRRNQLGWASPETYEAHYTYSRQCKLVTAHEMMHVYLRHYNPKAPLRFEEGVCRYFEWERIFVDNDSATCQFYRLAKLQPQAEWTVQNVFLPNYETKGQACTAAAFVSYLMEELRSQKFWDFYANTSEENYEFLLEKTLNIEINQINEEFKKHIQSLEDPPSLFLKAHTK